MIALTTSLSVLLSLAKLNLVAGLLIPIKLSLYNAFGFLDPRMLSLTGLGQLGAFVKTFSSAKSLYFAAHAVNWTGALNKCMF